MPSTSPVRASVSAIVVAGVISSGLFVWCQQSSSQLSPRELFYREQVSDHHQRAPATPAKTHVAAGESTGIPKAPGNSASPGSPEITGASAALVETSSATKSSPEVSHLGLRYRLLSVDKATGDATAVSSNQVFEQGDCFSLEFESNRSGYLYVFNLGSSGAWRPLLPTAEMPEESNFVPAFTTLRVPSSHCFRIAGPPGEEHLFVVLSRNPQEVDELNRSIRNGPTGESAPSHSSEAPAGTMMMASNLNQAVQKIVSLKGRDLEIQEIGGIKNSAENTPAVYVVHTSATPSDKVMTEIQIKHR